MKKRLLGIIAGLLFCGCMIGVIVLFKAPKEETVVVLDEQQSQSEQAGAHHMTDELLMVQGNDISSVTVNSASESFTMSVSSNGEMQIKELSGLRQDETLKKGLLELCRRVTAVKLVDKNLEDLDKYGLKNPASGVKITYTNAKSVKINMGTLSVDKNSYYAAVEGQKKVWLVEKNVQLYFSGKAKDYVSTVMSPKLDKSAKENDRITVIKPGEQEIVLERKGEKWSMISPINADLDEKKSAGTVNGLYSLNAQYCELIHPDETAKKAHGIGEKSVKVRLEHEKQKFTLYIGDPSVKSEGEQRDKRYCYLEGEKSVDCIFVIDNEYLPWAELTAQGMISKVAVADYLYDVKSVSVKTAEKTVEYTVYNNADASKKQTEKVTCSGKELDLYDFRKFYEFLMSLPTEQIYTKDDKKNADITISYTKNDDKSDKLELVRSGDGYGVRVNGKMSYFVKKNWAQVLGDNIQALEQGKSVKTEF